MLSSGENFALALIMSLVHAFFALTFDQYQIEIAAAPLSYRVIWYLLLGGTAFITGASLAAGLLRFWRGE